MNDAPDGAWSFASDEAELLSRSNGHANPDNGPSPLWTERACKFWDKRGAHIHVLFQGPTTKTPHEYVLDIVNYTFDRMELDDLLSMATFPDGFGGGTHGQFHRQWAREQWTYKEEKKREEEEAKRQVGNLRILSDDDLLAAKPRDYLIKGWISPAEISLVVGAKNSRKSFLMLHCARAVSQGRAVFGRRVKQASVLYVVCEGEHGIAQRNKALIRRYGKSTRFHVIAQPLDLLRCATDRSDLQDLIQAARTHDVGWIIIDTVSRVAPGAEQNASGDMGTFLHNLNLLRYETGAHITGIHHGTQQDGTKSNGHSVLPNGTDVIVQVEWSGGDDGIGTAVIGFARDDKTGTLGAFRTEEVTLGLDADRDEQTTLVINELDPAELPGPPVTGRAMHEEAVSLYRHITDLAARQGETGCPEPDMPPVPLLSRKTLTLFLADRGWILSPKLSDGGGVESFPDSEWKRLYKRLTTLQNKGLVGFNRRVVWLPRAPVQP